jgi:hypothetical protein
LDVLPYGYPADAQPGTEDFTGNHPVGLIEDLENGLLGIHLVNLLSKEG